MKVAIIVVVVSIKSIVAMLVVAEVGIRVGFAIVVVVLVDDVGEEQQVVAEERRGRSLEQTCPRSDLLWDRRWSSAASGPALTSPGRDVAWNTTPPYSTVAVVVRGGLTQHGDDESEGAGDRWWIWEVGDGVSRVAEMTCLKV